VAVGIEADAGNAEIHARRAWATRTPAAFPRALRLHRRLVGQMQTKRRRQQAGIFEDEDAVVADGGGQSRDTTTSLVISPLR